MKRIWIVTLIIACQLVCWQVISSFSAVFTYRTGNAMSLPVATYQSAAAPFWNYGASKEITFQTYKEARNNFRLPAYHRLDLSYQNSKKLNKGKKGFGPFLYTMHITS